MFSDLYELLNKYKKHHLTSIEYNLIKEAAKK